MKILIVTARYAPESFTIARIAEGLLSLGNSVTVLTGRPNYGAWRIYEGYENINNEIINGVNVVRVNEKARKKGFFGIIQNYWSIKKEFKKELKRIKCDFDIVLSHVMSPIFSISYLKTFCKKNNLPHMHYGFDLWPESLIASGYCKRFSPLHLALKPYCRKIYNSCDLIAFASPSAEQYLVNYLKVNTEFVHIYQPCLIEPPLANVDKKYNDSKIHILFCGTIAKFNHLDLFLNALNNPATKNRIIFDVVGSGSDLERMQKIVKKNNLTDCVIFHGRVSQYDTVDFYEKADVLFVPLFYNSATSLMIPQKLVEYLMYSKPIIGMIKGDGRDILTKASKHNYIVEQNEKSIRETLEKIITEDSSAFKECGRQNRMYYDKNERFHLDVVCKEINMCLKRLIANKKI